MLTTIRLLGVCQLHVTPNRNVVHITPPHDEGITRHKNQHIAPAYPGFSGGNVLLVNICEHKLAKRVEIENALGNAYVPHMFSNTGLVSYRVYRGITGPCFIRIL